MTLRAIPDMLDSVKAKFRSGLASMIQGKEIAAVILAGGRASRMNYQDKALLRLHDKPLIEHVIDKARHQVGQMLISVNRNLPLYEYLDIPLITDSSKQFGGPLVGIYSAMQWLQNSRESSGINYLACFAADVPYFPEDIVAQLARPLLEAGAQFACCRCDNQIQPLLALWSMDSIAIVKQALDDGLFGPKLLLPKLEHIIVDIPQASAENFLNINSPESLKWAESIVPRN